MPMSEGSARRAEGSVPQHGCVFRVRHAVLSDVDAIVALVNEAFRVERFFIDGDRTDAAHIAQRFESGRFLVAEDTSGRLAAAVYLEIRGDRGYFGLLAVDPARQRAGLGRVLVEAAEKESREAGCRIMDLQIVNLRTELPPFYRRLGYAESGEMPFAAEAKPKLPCHFIRMSKPLA
jgi:GNAT superfamily N-acetyltransferase